MSLETWKAKYPVIHSNTKEGIFEKLSLRDVVEMKNYYEPKDFVWSARLSTGIFGLPDCKSGNAPHAPKGENELILALGDEGLSHLIDLGFVPCPTCHPEETKDFWNKAKETIRHDYPELTDETQFLDRNLIPFDSRRVDWEKIAPFLTSLPNRLYVPPGLDENELISLKERLTKLRFEIPPVGYYDRLAPGRFFEYKLP